MYVIKEREREDLKGIWHQVSMWVCVNKFLTSLTLLSLILYGFKIFNGWSSWSIVKMKTLQKRRKRKKKKLQSSFKKMKSFFVNNYRWGSQTLQFYTFQYLKSCIYQQLKKNRSNLLISNVSFLFFI